MSEPYSADMVDPDEEPIVAPDIGRAPGVVNIVVLAGIGAGEFFAAGLRFGPDPWWATFMQVAIGVAGLVGAAFTMHRRAEYGADRANFAFMLGVMDGRGARDAHRDDH